MKRCVIDFLILITKYLIHIFGKFWGMFRINMEQHGKKGMLGLQCHDWYLHRPIAEEAK
jgi:hypothetical protein